MGKMDGKVALVAGNLGKMKKDKFLMGLGSYVAKDLADEGAQVIVVDIDPSLANACVEAIGSDKVKAKECDLLKQRVYETKEFVNERGATKSEVIWTDSPAHVLVKEIVEEFGKLDALITNFDYYEKAKLEKATNESYQKMYDLNITPLFHLLAAVRNQFSAQRKTAGTFAKVVMLTNMLGKGGASTTSIYSGMKAAVVHGVKTIAREFGKFANVNSIAMAPLSTKKMQGPADRMKKQFFLTSCARSNMDIKPEHVVPLVRLLASDEGDGICGQCLSVDGGLWLHAEV